MDSGMFNIECPWWLSITIYIALCFLGWLQWELIIYLSHNISVSWGK